MSNGGGTQHTLVVPGARLHYEVRGAGPVLLMIGAPMDSSGFAAIATLLADTFTVVTYDPRGIAASTRAATEKEVTPEVLADDAHRVLTALGAGSAEVFGSSGGAITGLALVARYPDQIRTLVAHEPPLVELLADRAAQRTSIDAVHDTYRREGTQAAMRAFFVATGIAPVAVGGSPPWAGGPQPGPDGLPMAAPMGDDLSTFLGYMLRPFTRYRPEIPTLRSGATRIVVGAGMGSVGQLPHRAATALADQLHTSCISFPGDHAGFAGEPAAFARTLRQLVANHQ